MKTGLKSVLWSAAALLLLLMIAVPLLNALAVSVMMIPSVILYSTLSKRSFGLHMLVVFSLAFAVIGPAALIIGLFFLVPAIVMGHMYRKQMPARKVITVTLLVLLAQLLLEMVLFNAVLDISLLDEMSSMIREMTDSLHAQGLLPAGWTAEATDLFIQTLIHSIPMALITVSFMYAVITHAVARPILRSSGMPIPGFQKAKDWMLPRIFVIYYLIILIVDLAVSKEGSSFLTVALLNLVPLMRLAFSVQAIGFFFFIADQRQWNKVVPILLSVLVIVFPPLSLIGVLDAGFPIRRAFKKP
ncbi:YybS family protein [Paenibacillus spongiae]|uniref:YybS family protein n=1 Tax=Paenibacillus spongiae TaxID=2909671 RepID=A0ABY5S8S7_9BACL|nr:YybS family protein [Paenibacillus spongiae]UVI30307.1 YybS family protein [Paenibacillus spongiae]